MPLPSATLSQSIPTDQTVEQRVTVLEDRMRRHQHTSLDKTTPLALANRQNITVAFGQFTATAGLTQNITIFNLPPFGEIISAFMYVQTAFAGTATLTFSVGITGSETIILTAQDVKTTGFKNTIGTSLTTTRAVYSATANTPIVLKVTATVNNLTLLTAGLAKIVLTYTVPTTT